MCNPKDKIQHCARRKHNAGLQAELQGLYWQETTSVIQPHVRKGITLHISMTGVIQPHVQSLHYGDGD